MNLRQSLLAIVAVCGSAAGCALASDPVAAPPPGEPAFVLPSPAACQRDHVYVFLVNGMDPFYFCQFNKTPCYVRSLGYEHVWLGQMTAKGKFLEEVRRVRAADPCARVVLIGFSTGANTVCSMSRTLKEEGCSVDLLVYLGACWIYNYSSSRPENAMRVVNIRDSGLITLTGGLLHGDAVDGAENVQIPGPTFHLMTPGSPVTQDTLAWELDAVAATVPVPATCEQPFAPDPVEAGMK